MHAAKLSNPNASFAVVYIGGVIGPARRVRRRAFRASAFLVALALALAAFGCGSGGDSATSSSTPTPIGADSSSDTGPDSDTVASNGSARSKPAKDGSHQGTSGGSADGKSAGSGDKANSEADTPASGNGHPGKATPDRGGQIRTPTQQAAVEQQAARHCPKGVALVQCEALVEGSKQGANSPSYTVSDPEDCLRAMSQEQCEATYKAQKEAAESAGPPVDVQECLKNMTPRCEAILRPLFEQQHAAEEASQ